MSEVEQLTAISQQVTDLRVLVATVAGDTRSILGRIDAQDVGHRDHEARLRDMERHPTSAIAADVEKLDVRLKDVENWRMKIVGAAAASGVLGGGIGAALSAALKLGH